MVVLRALLRMDTVTVMLREFFFSPRESYLVEKEEKKTNGYTR